MVRCRRSGGGWVFKKTILLEISIDKLSGRDKDMSKRPSENPTGIFHEPKVLYRRKKRLTWGHIVPNYHSWPMDNIPTVTIRKHGDAVIIHDTTKLDSMYEPITCRNTVIRTEILPEARVPDDRADGLVQLLQSWIDEGDEEEQRETLEYLIHALDEDRLSNRKLFPKELKGKSW